MVMAILHLTHPSKKIWSQNFEMWSQMFFDNFLDSIQIDQSSFWHTKNIRKCPSFDQMTVIRDTNNIWLF